MFLRRMDDEKGSVIILWGPFKPGTSQSLESNTIFEAERKMFFTEKIKGYLRYLGLLRFRSSKFPKILPITEIFRTSLLVLFFLNAISTLWYTIFEAETVEQYSQASQGLCGSVLTFGCYCLLLRRISNLGQLMDSTEKIIDQSECFVINLCVVDISWS